jgi:hypothetical protein
MICQCSKPGWCPTLKMCTNGDIFRICHGDSGLPNEEEYRQHWLNNSSSHTETECQPMPMSVQAIDWQAIPYVPRRKACALLGIGTGELIECGPCGGGVKLKIFECAIYKTCTLEKQVANHQCCSTCNDYRE